jgi:hypothetical protein
MHSGSGSAKAKSYGFCGSGSGSTTLVLRRSDPVASTRIRIRISSLMPIQVRIPFGIENYADPHADPVPSYTFWKIRLLFTFVHTKGSLYYFSFRISGKGVIILSILDSILGFYGKE